MHTVYIHVIIYVSVKLCVLVLVHALFSVCMALHYNTNICVHVQVENTKALLKINL